MEQKLPQFKEQYMEAYITDVGEGILLFYPDIEPRTKKMRPGHFIVLGKEQMATIASKVLTRQERFKWKK